MYSAGNGMTLQANSILVITSHRDEHSIANIVPVSNPMGMIPRSGISVYASGGPSTNNANYLGDHSQQINGESPK